MESAETKLAKAPDDVKGQFKEFIEEAKKETEGLLAECAEIRKLTNEMALYFCEDPKKFPLEECLSMLKQFCEKLTKAREVNILITVKQFLFIENLIIGTFENQAYFENVRKIYSERYANLSSKVFIVFSNIGK